MKNFNKLEKITSGSAAAIIAALALAGCSNAAESEISECVSVSIAGQEPVANPTAKQSEIQRKIGNLTSNLPANKLGKIATEAIPAQYLDPTSRVYEKIGTIGLGFDLQAPKFNTLSEVVCATKANDKTVYYELPDAVVAEKSLDDARMNQ